MIRAESPRIPCRKICRDGEWDRRREQGMARGHL